MSLAYSSSVTGSHHSLRVFSPGTSTAMFCLDISTQYCYDIGSVEEGLPEGSF